VIQVERAQSVILRFAYTSPVAKSERRSRGSIGNRRWCTDNLELARRPTTLAGQLAGRWKWTMAGWMAVLMPGR
jgi:hypothetical protein